MATEAPAGVEAPTLAQELATAAPVKAPDVKAAPAAAKDEKGKGKKSKKDEGKKSKKGKQASAARGRGCRAEHRRAPARGARGGAGEELGRAVRLPAGRLPVAADGHAGRRGAAGAGGGDRLLRGRLGRCRCSPGGGW